MCNNNNSLSLTVAASNNEGLREGSPTLSFLGRMDPIVTPPPPLFSELLNGEIDVRRSSLVTPVPDLELDSEILAPETPSPIPPTPQSPVWSFVPGTPPSPPSFPWTTAAATATAPAAAAAAAADASPTHASSYSSLCEDRCDSPVFLQRKSVKRNGKEIANECKKKKIDDEIFSSWTDEICVRCVEDLENKLEENDENVFDDVDNEMLLLAVEQANV